jgi:hypothetical protein
MATSPFVYASSILRSIRLVRKQTRRARTGTRGGWTAYTGERTAPDCVGAGAPFIGSFPSPDRSPMSLHTARIEWSRRDQPFTDGRYARTHTWTFDGGAVVPASSSPAGVRPPMSDP